MSEYEIIGDKISACVYINKDILQAVHRIGLNVSKVAENGLVDAIARLDGSGSATDPRSSLVPSLRGRGRDLNPGARLHRPIGYQATSPRPLFV